MAQIRARCYALRRERRTSSRSELVGAVRAAPCTPGKCDSFAGLALDDHHGADRTRLRGGGFDLAPASREQKHPGDSDLLERQARALVGAP
jgi:hypothetical protein